LEADLDPLGLFSQVDEEKSKKAEPQVGDDRLESFASHRHIQPMLSLDNTYDEKEFFEFDKRLQKIFGTEQLCYVVEPKIDGVAISLTYQRGNSSLQPPGAMGLKEMWLPKISSTSKVYPSSFLSPCLKQSKSAGKFS
jgi:hypothetical protein